MALENLLTQLRAVPEKLKKTRKTRGRIPKIDPPGVVYETSTFQKPVKNTVKNRKLFGQITGTVIPKTCNEVFAYVKKEANCMRVDYKKPTEGIWKEAPGIRSVTCVDQQYSTELGNSYQKCFEKAFFELLIYEITSRFNYNINDITIMKDPSSDTARQVWLKETFIFVIDIKKEWIYSKKTNFKIYGITNLGPDAGDLQYKRTLLYCGSLYPKKTYFLEEINPFKKEVVFGYFQDRENLPPLFKKFERRN